MSQENRALVGVVAPAMFGATIVALTVAQYDFLLGLGWRPVGDASGVPWPSGLALGPLGAVQVANFVLFGLALVLFAVGLHRGLAGGSKAGPALLAVAGVAMVLAGFKTDPDISGGPQSWHGMIHGIAYLLIVFSVLPCFFFLWWRMRKDSRWRGHGLYTLVTGVVMVILFLTPWSVSFYFFLALLLAWVEVTALKLRSLTANVPAEGKAGGAPWRTRAAP